MLPDYSIHCSPLLFLTFLFFGLFFLFLVEENLINREVEEELNSRTDHCCDVLSSSFITPFKTEEEVFEIIDGYTAVEYDKYGGR